METKKLISGAIIFLFLLAATNSLEPRSTVTTHADEVTAISVYGGVGYSGSRDGILKVWDASDGRLLKILEIKESKGIYAIKADDDYFYTGSGDNRVRVWSKTDYNLVRVLSDHGGKVNALALDDQFVYSASEDNAVKKWRKSDWVLLSDFTAKHADAVSSMVLYGDDLYSGSLDGAVKVWRKSDGYLKRTIKASDTLSVTSVAVDGEYIYAGLFDGSINVWRKSGDGSLVEMMTGHGGYVRALEADGGLLYSVSDDATIKIWNRTSASLFTTLAGHGGPVYTIAVADYRIYSGSSDRTVRVWAKPGVPWEVATPVSTPTPAPTIATPVSTPTPAPTIATPAPTISGQPGLEITSYPKEIFLERGWTKVFEITVNNTGTASLRNLQLKAEGLPVAEWTEVEPALVGSIPAGGYASFVLKISPPGNATSLERSFVKFVAFSAELARSEKISEAAVLADLSSDALLYRIKDIKTRMRLLAEVVNFAERGGKDVSAVRRLLNRASELLAEADGYYQREMYEAGLDLTPLINGLLTMAESGMPHLRDVPGAKGAEKGAVVGGVDAAWVAATFFAVGLVVSYALRAADLWPQAPGTARPEKEKIHIKRRKKRRRLSGKR